MQAIRGDFRLPDVGQEDREKVDPHTVTDEDLAASIDALTRRLSDMPEWSGDLIDPAKSAELVAARWGGKASYDKVAAPLTEAGMKSASLQDRAYALRRETGNWVNSDQAIWFLREITGMENAEMLWKFFIPTKLS